MLKSFLSKLRPSTEAVRTQLTVREDDNTFYVGDHASGLYRDRFDYDRATVQAECLRAWRVSPIARRIVKIYTEFIVGEGISIKCDHPATHKFLQSWWNHPLNNLSSQIADWCDERTRSGNLFFLVTTTPDGMTYLRCVPSELIKDIQTAENDIFQEKYYIPVTEGVSPWPAYDPGKPAADQNPFMLHYTTNKPVGTSWGESDLAPLIPWIGRYGLWLEDRVRLNKYRTAFLYIVRGQFVNKADKSARQRHLNANPPQPGSILVTDPSEEWGILSANLDAFDASVDGLAIKKMIALGAGIPIHYLAEPESSTSTTAEAAGTPTFAAIEQKQTTFVEMLHDLAQIAVTIRKEVDRRVKTDAVIEVGAPDITERDNATLALAGARAETMLVDLFDREMIEADEVLRMTYRMTGEVYEPKKDIKGKRKPLVAPGQMTLPNPNNDPKTDPGDAQEKV